MNKVKIISDASEIVLPESFKCPICGSAVHVDEVSEWEKEGDEWKAQTVKIDCVTFPGFEDSDAFENYMSGHYSMPYVDWMPLEKRVTAWINARYSWQL